MGCFLISFCLGNSRLPFAHRLPGHAQQHRQLLLRHIACIAQVQKLSRKLIVSRSLSNIPWYPVARRPDPSSTPASASEGRCARHNRLRLRRRAATAGCVLLTWSALQGITLHAVKEIERVLGGSNVRLHPSLNCYPRANTAASCALSVRPTFTRVPANERRQPTNPSHARRPMHMHTRAFNPARSPPCPNATSPSSKSPQSSERCGAFGRSPA